jgi:hypothetical protein
MGRRMRIEEMENKNESRVMRSREGQYRDFSAPDQTEVHISFIPQSTNQMLATKQSNSSSPNPLHPTHTRKPTQILNKSRTSPSPSLTSHRCCHLPTVLPIVVRFARRGGDPFVLAPSHTMVEAREEARAYQTVSPIQNTQIKC